MTPVPADATLRLKTLSPLPHLVLVAGDGSETILFGPGKPLALLIYLSLLPDRTATRVHLTDLLWADADLERSRQSLRQAIWQIRRKLGEAALVGDGEQITLTAQLSADHTEVGVALRNGVYEEVVRLHQGEFLSEFGVPGGAEFEHWADGVRERLRSGWLRALDALARDHLNRGRTREAIPLIRRLRDANPASEAVWRLLLETLLLMGDVVGSGIEADALQARLAAEHREPETQTAQVLRRVHATPVPAGELASSALVAELIGREGEFRRLTQAWERARSGESAHLHLRAPAGIGKTRLLRDAERRLRGMGGRVLYLRAPPGSRQIPYAFAADLARALLSLPGASGVAPSSLATLLALDPSLASLFPGTPDPSEGPEALRRRAIAMADLILAIGEESPVALLLDDVHWMDRESLQVVVGLRSRLSGSPSMLATAGRPFPDGQLVESDAEVLALPPLTEAQVEALVTSLGQLPETDWAHALVERLHQAAGGSPHLVLETIQLCLDRGWLHLGEAGWRCPNPSRIDVELPAGNALRRRVDALDPAARELLSLLAVAATPVRAGAVAAAAGRPEGEVLSVLGTLEVRGFVSQAEERWRLGHDELAETVLHGLEDAAVSSLAKRLGASLALQPALSSFDHQRAAELVIDGGDEQLLVPLFQRWLAMGRRLGDPRSDAELARALLGGTATAERLRRLLRARPVHRRLGLDTRPRRWGVAGFGVLMLGAVAFVVDRGASRPSELVLLQAPISGNQSSIVPVPIVEVRDKRGRRVQDAQLEVRVDAVEGPGLVLGTTAAVTKSGIATFNGIGLALDAPLGTTLRFSAPGMKPLTVTLAGAETTTLWLEHASINQQALTPDSPVLTLAPGEAIEGEVVLRYSAYWTAASIILGAFPTWGDKHQNFQTISALATPVRDAVVRFPLNLPGPERPGDYHLIFAFAAETDSRWIASATNWSAGAPMWDDGNDLADLEGPALDEANQTGYLTVSWYFTNINGYDTQRTPATVIDVRVR